MTGRPDALSGAKGQKVRGAGFGEALPESVAREAWRLAASCQTMLVVGTSGLVQPAAELPFIARAAGATVIEINPDPSEVSAAHILCRAPAGAVLPALVAALTEGEPH